MSDDRDYLSEMVNRIVDAVQPEYIVLFGSCAPDLSHCCVARK
ncbi:MAG: hypothetical protein ABFD54_10750 [Armatimonadota bacterium]